MNINELEIGDGVERYTHAHGRRVGNVLMVDPAFEKVHVYWIEQDGPHNKRVAVTNPNGGTGIRTWVSIKSVKKLDSPVEIPIGWRCD